MLVDDDRVVGIYGEVVDDTVIDDAVIDDVGCVVVSVGDVGDVGT